MSNKVEQRLKAMEKSIAELKDRAVTAEVRTILAEVNAAVANARASAALVNGKVAEILDDMRFKVLEYGTTWGGYFFAMSAQYSTAFEQHKTMLKEIHQSIEAERKQAEENRLVALSMLTAGIGGLFATHFAQKIAVGTLKPDVAEQGAKDLIGKAVGVVTGAGKDLIDKAQEKTGIKNSSSSNEGYVPSGASPGEYGGMLLSGLAKRMQGLIGWVPQPKAVTALTVSQVEHLRTLLLKQDYFTKAPSGKFEGKDQMDKLRDRAKLALWIAWAIQQDGKYWQTQVATRMYPRTTKELPHFEPLRKELLQLGVPKENVNLPKLPPVGIGLPRRDINEGVDIKAFQEWAASKGAMELLFQGLPQNEDGMQWVKERWTGAQSKKK